jgi:hypothetical protein
MIFQNVVAALRRQNWPAIGIELLIVIIGVFIGTQVSNWNQARTEREATKRMLVQFAPELQAQIEFLDSTKTYYATARRFANEALAAWSGDRRISDERFVIAAYQASQIYGAGVNGENWTLTFGGEQVRNIQDPKVRRSLEVVLTQDYSAIQLSAVSTPYREQVRRIIPIHIQDRIRRECGDRQIRNTPLAELPATCALRLAPAEAEATAAALRARRDLPGELNWHLAAVAAYQETGAIIERLFRALHRDLEKFDSNNREKRTVAAVRNGA